MDLPGTTAAADEHKQSQTELDLARSQQSIQHTIIKESVILWQIWVHFVRSPGFSNQNAKSAHSKFIYALHHLYTSTTAPLWIRAPGELYDLELMSFFKTYTTCDSCIGLPTNHSMVWYQYYHKLISLIIFDD